MATIILTVAGSYFFGPWGARFGMILGSYIDRKYLFAPDPAQIEGPRIENARVQLSNYGAPIPKLWATMRLAGNVFWAAPTLEIKEVEEEGGIEITTYSYFATCAIGMCQGPVADVLRVWADTDLIYSKYKNETNPIVKIDGFAPVFYPGNGNHIVSEIMESYEGDGEVPAYHNLAYEMMIDFPLDKWGNRIPNFTFEVTTVDKTEAEAEGWYEPCDVNEVDATEGGLFGADELRTYKSLWIIHKYGNKWWFIDARTRLIVSSSSNLWGTGLTGAISAVCDYDIITGGSSLYDGLIVSSGDNLHSGVPGLNTEFFVLIDPWTLRVILTSENYSEESELVGYVDSPTHLRVHNLSHMVWINYHGDLIHGKFHWDSSIGNIWDTFDPGINMEYRHICRHGAVMWAVASSTIGAGATKVTRIGGIGLYQHYSVAECEDGYAISYDPLTDQILIASHGSGGYVAFFTTDMEYVGRVDGCDPSYPKSSFSEKPKGGKLYIPHNNKVKVIDTVHQSVETLCTPEDSFYGGGIYHKKTQSFFLAVQGDENYGLVQIMLGRWDDVAKACIPLSEIVRDICLDCGLTEAEIDVSELTQCVKGYLLNTATTGRAALEPLRDAFFFDIVESEGKLKFPLAGKDSVVTIPETDLGAHLSGEQRPQNLMTVRQQELELPNVVEIGYVDASFNYQSVTQRARRLITQSRNKVSLNIPVNLDADEAVQAAWKHLAIIWMRRNSHTLPVPLKYGYLDPADVITVEENGNTHVLKVLQMAGRGTLIDLSVVSEDASIYVSEAEGAWPTPPSQDVDYPGPTWFVLMDLPLLLHAENRPGVYLALMGFATQWRGAEIYKSLDGGSTWIKWATGTTESVIGRTVTALGDVNDPFVWDHGNTVAVVLPNTDDSLSSATEAQLLADPWLNLAAIGEELVQFKSAVDNGDGTWTLSGFIRAVKGSDYATGSHAAGESFVLLDSSDYIFVSFGLEDRNNTRHYNAVSIGAEREEEEIQELSVAIRNMMPLSPQHIKGVRETNDDITITWFRRTRYLGEWDDEVDVPIAESSESYEIDIYYGGSIVRTISETTEEATYTAAQQTADGVPIGATISVIVYQISSDVSRGFASEQVSI